MLELSKNKTAKKKVKVTYLISNIEKAVAFEWIVEELKSTIVFEFIILNNNFNTPLVDFLKTQNIKFKLYKLGSKPILIFLWLKLFIRLLINRPNVVHTHLFEASLLGLSAAKLAGIKGRVYTRHHSNYHHNNFPRMVKFDKLINNFSTQIIAISENVRSILINKEKVKKDKIKLVEHGFLLEKFIHVDSSIIKELRAKYNIPSEKWIVGCISRYIEWKGVEYIIEAFKELQKIQPNVHLVLANSDGPYLNKIKSELEKFDQDLYTEIAFEQNLFALYKIFDCFVHCPIDKYVEAFGQTYVEALAAGIPSVFTISGIAVDFIERDYNAIVVNYKSSDEILEAMLRIKTDDELRSKLQINGLKSVQKFSLTNMTDKLFSLYDY
jgi:glycosyltransferase involved in cell wall biosynthesis